MYILKLRMCLKISFPKEKEKFTLDLYEKKNYKFKIYGLR